LKKRKCKRFLIPGTTLYYGKKASGFFRQKYSEDFYPVINLSRGGAKFLCNERLRAGSAIMVKLNIIRMALVFIIFYFKSNLRFYLDMF